MNNYTVIYANTVSFNGFDQTHIQIEYITVPPFSTIEKILGSRRIKDVRYLFPGHHNPVYQRVGIIYE